MYCTSVFFFLSKLVHEEEKSMSLSVDLLLVITLSQVLGFLLLVYDNF